MNLLQYISGETDQLVQDRFQDQVRYSTVKRLENGIPFMSETFKRHGFEFVADSEAIRVERFNISSGSDLCFIVHFYVGYITFFSSKTGDFFRNQNGTIFKINTSYLSIDVINQLKFGTYQGVFYIYHKDFDTSLISYNVVNNNFLQKSFDLTTIVMSDINTAILDIKMYGRLEDYNTITGSDFQISPNFTEIYFYWLDPAGSTRVPNLSFITVNNGNTTGRVLGFSGPIYNPSNRWAFQYHDIYFRLTGKSFYLEEQIAIVDQVYIEIYAYENNDPTIGLGRLKHRNQPEVVLQNTFNKAGSFGNTIIYYEGGGSTDKFFSYIYNGPFYKIDYQLSSFYKFKYLQDVNFAHGAIYKQRHWGFSQESIYASAPNQFSNFTLTGAVSGFAYDVSAGLAVKTVDDQLNSYVWVAEYKDRLIFGHQSRIMATNPGVDVTNFSISMIYSQGVANVEPVSIKERLYFADQSGTRLLSIGINEYNVLQVYDLSMQSNHPFILQNGIKRLSYQKSYYTILWVLDNAGNLFAFNPDTLVWSRIITQGTIQSITTIEGSAKDHFYLLANRAINGTNKTFTERWLDQRDQDIPLQQQFYLDAGKSFYNSTPQTDFTISHLPNTDIRILADGQNVDLTTDSNGSFTLLNPVQYLKAGLSYSLKAKTHPVEIAFNLFSSKFKFKRITDVILTVIKSFKGFTVYFYNHSNQTYSRDYNSRSNVIDSPVSDTIRITTGTVVRGQTDITIEHSEPNQCILTSLQINMDAN